MDVVACLFVVMTCLSEVMARLSKDVACSSEATTNLSEVAICSSEVAIPLPEGVSCFLQYHELSRCGRDLFIQGRGRLICGCDPSI